MDRIQTYYLIGKILSADFHPASKNEIIQHFSEPDFNWNGLIAMASNHLVLQTLFVKLKNQNLLQYLPTEIHDHIEYIHRLNCDRNTGILDQVRAINRILNQNEIIPLYMKGVGNILDKLYESPGERIMHDIDILVPDDQWETTANLLILDGYTFSGNIVTDPLLKYKHFPPLIKVGCKASVEIHRIPVGLPDVKLLDTTTVWGEKKLIDNGSKCYVMSHKHNIIHNFIHSQLTHNGQRFARVSYRYMYDMLLFSKHENMYTVLSELRSRKSQTAGYLRVLQKAFGLQATHLEEFKYKGVLFAFRHELNLRSRNLSIFTFYFSSIIKAYVLLPIKSLTNKELFISLIKRLLDKNWYKQHFASYSRIYTNPPNK